MGFHFGWSATAHSQNTKRQVADRLCRAHVHGIFFATKKVPESALVPKVPESTLAPRVPESTLAPKVPEGTPAAKVPETALTPKVPESTLAAKVPENTLVSKVPETTLAPKVPESALAPTSIPTLSTKKSNTNQSFIHHIHLTLVLYISCNCKMIRRDHNCRHP